MSQIKIKKAAADSSSTASQIYSSWEPGAEERNEMVRVAAYFIAERDGFRGSEAEYWAAAEHQVSLILALRESQAKLQIIIDTALDAVVVMDNHGVVTSWNNNAANIFGWTREEAVGKLLHEMIIPPQYRQAHVKGMKRFLDTGKSQVLNSRIEMPAQNRDGHEFTVELSIVPIKLANKYEFSAFVRDISERKQMEEQVRQLAFHDTLTQLPNRRLLTDRLSQTMAASMRNGLYAAMIFLDLDNFKPLNDIHGHAVGDLLLIEVANRLKSCVREMDTVARFGGDEFVIMIRELATDKAESKIQAEIIAEKIRTTLAEPYQLKLKPGEKDEVTIVHRCTASIGVCLFLDHEASQEDILKWADAAMYRAKDSGRNVIRFYEAKA
jgi:diguanylate cyclase (GGDEF)-like protein/PAS domain S-box-containing protein